MQSPAKPGRASRLERVTRVERARSQQRAPRPATAGQADGALRPAGRPASGTATREPTTPGIGSDPRAGAATRASARSSLASADLSATLVTIATPVTIAASVTPVTPETPAPTTTGTSPVTAAPSKTPARKAKSAGTLTSARPAAVSKAVARTRASRRLVRRHGPLTAGIAALALVLVVVGTLALVLSLRSDVESSGDSQAARNAQGVREAKARSAAANWIVADVSRLTKVACDHVMCGALAQRGFPARDLLLIKPKAPYPASAAIVVVTPAAGRQLGPGTELRRAPAVLAGFGGGKARIAVRVVARHGAAAYRSALRADHSLSRTVGSGLVTSSQITSTAAARKAMTSGEADARLLIVITALAARHPIDILGFGASSAGATPGLPLRIMDLAVSDQVVPLSQRAYVRSMKELLRAQPPKYRPLRVTIVPFGTGHALRIQFAAPSPLGLLSPHK